MQISLRSGETVGAWHVQRAFLTFRTNLYVFLLPRGVQMDASNPQKIVLTDTSNSYFITVRFTDPSATNSQNIDIDACRALALNRYPNAKLAGEFSETAANHSGPGFDFNWINVSGVEQSARVVFIPLVAGVMEFNLIATSSKFKDGNSILTTVLSSLKTNEEGKLDITPLGDRS